jgi:hypothetical protein
VIDGGYSDVTVVGGSHPTKRHELYVTLNGIHIHVAFSSLSDPQVQAVVVILYIDM